ncbi:MULTISPECIES: hypothetical protein [Sphingobacterium]|uniref:hypothetical protein n=1 Tax=Sphingobacterium TaxID=28453 RepID=UPI00259557D3|nr:MULTISPECIES: hypothetical protein [Sphingobacterium]
MAKSYKVSVFAGTKVVADMAQQVKNATIEASIQVKTIKGGATSATATILPPGPAGANRKMEDVQGWFVNGTSAEPPVATGTAWEAPAGKKNTNWWDGTTWSLGSSVPLPVLPADGEVLPGETKAINGSEAFNKISASIGWKIVPLTTDAKAIVVKSTPNAIGFLKTEGKFGVFNFSGGYYILNPVKILFSAGNDVLYLSSNPSTFSLLENNTTVQGEECYVRTMPLSSERNINTVVIGVSFAGLGWDTNFPEFKIEDGDMGYVIKPNSKESITVIRNTDKSIKVTINERTAIFSPRNGANFLWLNPQSIIIPNGSYLILKKEGDTAGTTSFYFNTDIERGTYVDFAVVDYNVYDITQHNAVIAFNWGGILTTSSESLLNEITSNLDISKHINSASVINNIAPFLNKVYELTDSDMPLEIMLLGDSINNFQHTGGAETWKSDKTVEPQSLYGNTLARWIWRKLNYTFSNRGDDSVSNPFSSKKTEEWGNLRFLRVDNTNVVKNGEFIPHGTREDGTKIFWERRELIGTGSTALGAFRGVSPDKDVISTSIGNIQTHNRVYFFNKDLDSSVQFTLPATAKGFSINFWGDESNFPYPVINGGDWLYLSTNVQIEVDGIVVENLDLTTYRGQSRKDFVLINTGNQRVVKITNKDSGRLMNLWGVEYWVGKCVRLTNYALAGNPAQSYISGREYWLDNKKADLIIWQLSNLNNINGYDETANFRELGKILLSKDIPILATNCHSPVESNPTSTNYKERATSIKLYQHPDVWGANKALDTLNIPYLNSWAVFCEIGSLSGFEGEYSGLFIDTAHVATGAVEIYKKIFDEVI